MKPKIKRTDRDSKRGVDISSPDFVYTNIDYLLTNGVDDPARWPTSSIKTLDKHHQTLSRPEAGIVPFLPDYLSSARPRRTDSRGPGRCERARNVKPSHLAVGNVKSLTDKTIRRQTPPLGSEHSSSRTKQTDGLND